jgi:hypothetical protein
VGLEIAEEGADVILGRVFLQDPVGQPGEGPVVDQGEDTEGAVVQFIEGDVAAEALQAASQIVGLDAGQIFFPRRPRPSSGSWPRGRRRDGRARGANSLSDTGDRPRRPSGRQSGAPDGCSGTWAVPGRTCRR